MPGRRHKKRVMEIERTEKRLTDLVKNCVILWHSINTQKKSIGTSLDMRMAYLTEISARRALHKWQKPPNRPVLILRTKKIITSTRTI